MKLVGKLIRRRTINGKLIGPYLLVTMCDKYGAYGLNTSSKKKNVYFIQRKNVQRIKEIRLSLEVNTFKRVIEGRQTAVCHPITTHYKNLLEKEFDVICFYNAYGDYAYYKYDRNSICKKRDPDNGKNYVYVKLGDLIYKQ